MQSISLSHSYSAMSSLCYLSYQSSWLKIFCTRKNIFEFTQVVTFSQKSVLILNQISTLQPQLLYRTVAIINTLLSCRSHVAIIYNMCLTDTFVVLFFFSLHRNICLLHTHLYIFKHNHNIEANNNKENNLIGFLVASMAKALAAFSDDLHTQLHAWVTDVVLVAPA